MGKRMAFNRQIARCRARVDNGSRQKHGSKIEATQRSVRIRENQVKLPRQRPLRLPSRALRDKIRTSSTPKTGSATIFSMFMNKVG